MDGVELSVSDGVHIERKLVRCAIICCSCDLPAERRLCGFLGHLDCSKCTKFFPSMENGLDHSGFDRGSWIPRTNHSHRQNVMRLSRCKTKNELNQREKRLGCRYSSLLELPYFDTPTMLVIACHIFKRVVIEGEILSEADLTTISKPY